MNVFMSISSRRNKDRFWSSIVLSCRLVPVQLHEPRFLFGAVEILFYINPAHFVVYEGSMGGEESRDWYFKFNGICRINEMKFYAKQYAI